MHSKTPLYVYEKNTLAYHAVVTNNSELRSRLGDTSQPGAERYPYLVPTVLPYGWAVWYCQFGLNH